MKSNFYSPHKHPERNSVFITTGFHLGPGHFTSFSCLFVLSCHNTPWHSMRWAFQSMIISTLDGVGAAWIWVPSSLSSISSLLCKTNTWSEIVYLKPESSISPLMGYRKKKKNAFPWKITKRSQSCFPQIDFLSYRILMFCWEEILLSFWE